MTRKEYVQRLWMAGGVAVVAAMSVLFLRQLTQVLLLLFSGALFAVVVDGLARTLERWISVPRKVAALLVVALALIVLAVTAWWSGPRLISQLGGLLERLPEVTRNLVASIERTEWGSSLVDRIGGMEGEILGGGQALGGVTRMFSTITGMLSSTLVVMFVTVYLAYDPEAYRRPLLALAPDPDRRAHLNDVLGDTARVLKLWMKARVLSMATVGVLTAIALSILGIELAIALALVAAVLAFVPFIGPILASLPAILIGLGDNPRTALIIAIIYLAIQLVESYIITPIIEKKVISLPPAYVIAVQVLMGTLFGLVGIFLASPIAVTVVVFVRNLYLEGALNRDLEELPA